VFPQTLTMGPWSSDRRYELRRADVATRNGYTEPCHKSDGTSGGSLRRTQPPSYECKPLDTAASHLPTYCGHIGIDVKIEASTLMTRQSLSESSEPTCAGASVSGKGNVMSLIHPAQLTNPMMSGHK